MGAKKPVSISCCKMHTCSLPCAILKDLNSSLYMTTTIPPFNTSDLICDDLSVRDGAINVP